MVQISHTSGCEIQVSLCALCAGFSPLMLPRLRSQAGSDAERGNWLRLPALTRLGCSHIGLFAQRLERALLAQLLTGFDPDPEVRIVRRLFRPRVDSPQS